MAGTPLCLIVLLCVCGGARVASAAVEYLQVDPLRSTIEVLVRGTTGSFTGRVEDFSSTLEVDSDRGRIQQALIVVPFSRLRTGRNARDLDMLRWLESSEFPEIRFLFVSLEKTPAGPALAHGRLTLHGVERSISIPVSLLIEGTRFSLDGEFEVDYRDHGLRMLRRFFLLTVDPKLRVRFHLQGRIEVSPDSPAAGSPSTRF